MEAMKVISRVFAVMRVWRVGQVEMGPEVEVGVYPYSLMPLDTKTDPNADASSSSELTRRSVTTSFVFASIHVLISAKNDSSVPASRRVQVVWQSSKVPF